MLPGRMGRVIEVDGRPYQVQGQPATDLEWTVAKGLRRRKIPFRFQQPFAGGRSLGGMVVDFALYTHILILMIHGWSHDAPDVRARDVLQEQYLKGEGWRVRVLREWDVWNLLDEILDTQLGIPMRGARDG